MAIISAALTSIFDTILAWVQQPYVYFSAGVFIFVLWTSIGIKVLFDARKPRIVRSLHDYAYALVCEGCTLARDEESDNAAFQIGINFRNFCNGPMKLKVTDFRVIIGDRTVAPPENISIMILPRGAAKGFAYPAFKKDAVTPRATGNAFITIQYGHPEGEYIREFKAKMEISLRLDEKSGIACGINSETDIAI